MSRITLDPLDELDQDLKETSETARRDGDLRLAVQSDGLRMKLLEVRERLRDRAHGQEDDIRKKALHVLSQLPDGYVQSLRDGEPEAFKRIEKALPASQEGLESGEPADAAIVA